MARVQLLVSVSLQRSSRRRSLIQCALDRTRAVSAPGVQEVASVRALPACSHGNTTEAEPVEKGKDNDSPKPALDVAEYKVIGGKEKENKKRAQ
jgi:hypothetical protein